MVRPQGVCIDKHGHIIVADSGNDRIHLLSAQGRFQQFILTAREGTETPVAVGTDQEGHLVFTEGATAELKSYLYLTWNALWQQYSQMTWALHLHIIM